MARRLIPALVAVILIGATVFPGDVFGAAPPVVPRPGAYPGTITHDPVCGAVPDGVARCHARIRTDALVRGEVPAPVAVPSTGTVGNGGAYDPVYLQSAYNLKSASASMGHGRTVAIVDAYDDPTAESDLNQYRSHFQLTACTTANGCFRKVNQNGAAGPYPAVSASWAQEISLDLDMVSAICPNCNVMLVEANSSSIDDLGTAANTAASLGVTAISNSYGATEWSGQVGYYDSLYNHPGIAVTASAGDSGYGVEFPAASAYTIAVGGTTLNQTTNTGSRNATETVWKGSGSGCSAYEPKPTWQKDPGCAHRTVADVAAVADPATGVWVYDSTPSNGQSGWLVFGGTSVSSPIISSVFALAANGSNPSAANLYAPGASLFDITSGSNGSCGGSYLCTGQAGYDGPTGNGTPNNTSAFVGSSGSTATNTPTSTATATSTMTSTPTSTSTPIATNTSSPTPIATNTMTMTPTPTSTPTNGSAGTPIFNDGFESGNFSAWTTTAAIGSGSASVSTTAPYAGSDDGYFTRSTTQEVADKAVAIDHFTSPSSNVVWAREWVRFESIPSAWYWNIDNVLQVDDRSSLDHPKARFGAHSGGKLFYSYLKKDGTWYQADWGTLTLGTYYGLKIEFDTSGANPVITWFVNTGSGWTSVASYTDTSSGNAVAAANEIRVGTSVDTGTTYSDPSYAGTAQNRVDQVVVSSFDPDSTGNGSGGSTATPTATSTATATSTSTSTPTATATNTVTMTPTPTSTPTNGSAGTPIFNDGFESGNFSAWTTTAAIGSGSASVSTTAPYAGSDDGYFTRSSTQEVADKAAAIDHFTPPSSNVVWAREWVRFDSIPSAWYWNIDNVLQVDDRSSLDHPKARFGAHNGGKLFYSYLKKDGTWYQADWGTLTLGTYYGLKIEFDTSGANPVITWFVNTGSGWTSVASYTDTSSGSAVAAANEIRVGTSVDMGTTYSDPSYAGTAQNRVDQVEVSSFDPDSTGNGSGGATATPTATSTATATSTSTSTPTPIATNTVTMTPTPTSTPTNGGAGTPIFSDGFESGNFSAWTTTAAVGSGSASVSTTAPYAGSDDGYFTRSATQEVADKAVAIEHFTPPSSNVVWAREWVRFESIPSAWYWNIDNVLQVDDRSSLDHPKARFGAHNGGKLFYSYLKKDGTWYQADWGTLTLGTYYGLKIEFDTSGANPVITWFVNTGSGWTSVASYTDTSSGSAVAAANELRVGTSVDTGTTYSDPSYAGTAQNRVDQVVVSATDPG